MGCPPEARPADADGAAPGPEPAPTPGPPPAPGPDASGRPSAVDPIDRRPSTRAGRETRPSAPPTGEPAASRTCPACPTPTPGGEGDITLGEPPHRQARRTTRRQPVDTESTDTRGHDPQVVASPRAVAYAAVAVSRDLGSGLGVLDLGEDGAGW